MVSKEIINNIIDNVISAVVVKCFTRAQIREKLAQYSYTDRYNQLKDKSLLNPLEDKDYVKKTERLKDLDDYFESHGTDDLIGAEVSMYEERGKIVDELFEYDRRLIEGYETSFPIDLKDYQDKAGQPDEQYQLYEEDEFGAYEYTYEITSRMGYHEEQTVEQQINTINVNPNDTHIVTTESGGGYEVYDDNRLVSMNNYFSGDIDHINYEINNKKYLNKLENETRKNIKNIDSLIKESKGLPYNTLLFRGGHFNIHTRVGESIKFKGYQSTSFQQSVSKDYMFNDDDMLYLIHAPKGTKGIAGNDDRFNNGFHEHEYVLPRNTKMKVIRIDYENNVCEVVIED